MKKSDHNLKVEWLREHMAYVPEVGVFMWKVRGPGRTVGKVLGSVTPLGYVTIKVDGIVYYAHRLAWFYTHGVWPKGPIDHINSVKTDNAIANLREATHAQNAARRPTTRTLAPSRGVFPHGTGFVARIHHSGKRHYLGYFKTAAEARAAYEAKAQEIYGEFAHVERLSDFDQATAAAVARSPHRDWLLVATPGFDA